MIIDDETAPLPACDVCIVGSGPVGLALAFRCAEQGLTVTILEAGYRRASGQMPPRPAVELVNAHHAGTEIAMMQSIGGSAHLWGGRCVALDDIDFATRPHVPHSGWPITHRDLHGHYEPALRFLGCAPGVGDRTVATDADITMDNPEWWSRNPDVSSLHEAAIRTSPRVHVVTGCQALIVRLNGERTFVEALEVARGGRRMAASARSFVLAAGGLENTRILLATQRDAAELFGGQDGPLGRFYCGHLTGYLAAIRFREPRSADRLWFRPAGGGAVNRRRMALSAKAQQAGQLLNTAFWLDSFSISDASHGSGLLSALYMALRGMALYPRLRNGLAPAGDGASSLAAHASNLFRSPVRPLNGVRLLGQLVAAGHRRRAFALYNPEGRYLLRYHAEHAPHRDSRVTLVPNDAGGRLKVDLRFHDVDFASVIRAHEQLDAWLRDAGLGALDYLGPVASLQARVEEQAVDGFHQIGLTRMSTDRGSGVVDRDCKVHDLANLYVAGSSVFPTAGQANPTLPAVALALRLGAHLAERLSVRPVMHDCA